MEWARRVGDPARSGPRNGLSTLLLAQLSTCLRILCVDAHRRLDPPEFSIWGVLIQFFSIVKPRND